MPLSTTVKVSAGAASLLAIIAGISLGLDQLSTKNPKISFDHVLTGTETIETDVFRIYENGVGTVIPVRCQLVSGVNYKCEADAPAVTPGRHTFTIKVTNSKGEEGLPSDPFEYRTDAVIKP